MSWFKMIAAALVMAVTALPVFAQNVTDNEHGVLKLDRKNADMLPKNFRTSEYAFEKELLAGPAPSRLGMENLRISGSSAFSELEYEQIIKHIPAAPEKIYDVDLRGETHGYINGDAVSWYKEKDWGNKGKKHDYIVNTEKKLFAEIRRMPVIEVGILGANKEIVPGKYYTFDVKEALTEQQMTARHGTKYLRLTLTDHLSPNHAEVDRFIRFCRTVPDDAWLHFHCFAGKGRTTTFMVMYDMIKNAGKVAFSDIVMRQFAIGGINLTAYNPNKPVWRQKAVNERIAFLKDFYQYVRENPKLEKTWTQWVKEHNASQEAVKELGANGGGFFSADSSPVIGGADGPTSIIILADQ